MTAGRYRILVFEREAPLRGGQGVRLTRIEVKPSAAADVIEAFGDSAVPDLAETPGFRSALLFADPASGHLISQTVWRDPQAANCLIRAVEDYSLVFSSARKA